MTFENKLKKALESNNINEIHAVFDEIYSYYGKLIYFIVIKDVNNNQDAEEITQDVFVNFFNNLTKTSINNIKYYLVRTAKNITINFIKSHNKEITINNKIIYKDNENKYNDEYERIINKMKKHLSEYEIDIVVKHVVYDYKFKELAYEHNKSINTIFATYNRAIKKIRKGENKNEKQ